MEQTLRSNKGGTLQKPKLERKRGDCFLIFFYYPGMSKDPGAASWYLVLSLHPPQGG